MTPEPSTARMIDGDALAERLRVAIERLHESADEADRLGRFSSADNSSSKAEGVRLALSYVEEAIADA